MKAIRTIDKASTERLSCSEVRDAGSLSRCCDHYFLLGIVGMPLATSITGQMISCPAQFRGDGPTSINVFEELVGELRQEVDQLISQPRELINYLHAVFQNRFTGKDGGEDLSWSYVMDSTKRGLWQFV